MDDKEIDKLLREIVPNRANYIDYYKGFDEIQLDGTFSSNELRGLANLMDEFETPSKEL